MGFNSAFKGLRQKCEKTVWSAVRRMGNRWITQLSVVPVVSASTARTVYRWSWTRIAAFLWIMLLPYFSQLAKVFSQGKYYVGGPWKVQICRNCLLTNTLIVRFCLFTVVINCCLSRTINGTCAPVCLFTVTVPTRECLSVASSLSKQIPHYLPKWSHWLKFKFRIRHWPNLSF
jgi:hypothetical protein